MRTWIKERRACTRDKALALLAALAAVTTVALTGCGTDTAGHHASRPASWDWPSQQHDASNTRRTRGPLDASSVHKLGLAWRIPLFGNVGTPIVRGDVVYVQDTKSNVFAIELTHGRVLWETRYDEATVGPNGVAVGGGRVYATNETRVFALDVKTGKQVWTRRLVTNDHEGIDMAPGFRKGTVYVSTVPANGRVAYGAGARGVLWALDARTGRKRWTWSEVPADLWGRRDVNAGGGLWHAPAFDGQGNLYVDVANPAPFPGTPKHPWATSRPGPNKWTDSIVKLSERTGKVVWGRQVLPHDLYDWDLECPVILTQVQGRAVALAAGKMGFVFEFDTAGKLLWKHSVGVHNGHDHDSALALHGETSKLRSPVDVLPGLLGGVETPMAIDGDTVYVPVENLAGRYSARGLEVAHDAAEATGEVVALDLATGRVKWDRLIHDSMFGAATVVNDLVFTSTFHGKLMALRTDTGKVVWTATLPAGSNAPVAIAGDTVIASAGVLFDASHHGTLAAYRLRP